MTPKQVFVIEIAEIFMIIFFIAYVTISIVGGVAFYKNKDSANAFHGLIVNSNILEIITIILVAAAVTNLFVINKITPEAALAVLSGIVGYVLGGIRGGYNRAKPEPISEANNLTDLDKAGGRTII